MRTKKLAFILITSTLSIFHLLYPGSAFGAELFFSSPHETKAGENLELVVTLDTGGASINGVELVINYDNDLLSFYGYSDENSVIKLYIDPPHSERKPKGTQTEKIYLSGIIPGGVQGLYDASKKNEGSELSPLPLVHLFFTTKQAGTTNFSFENSEILLNDGAGTHLPHEALQAEIIIKDNPDLKNVITPKTEIQRSKDTNLTTIVFLGLLILALLRIFVHKLLKYRYEKRAK